jgi:acetylornithine deacetylase/succinyl-diaminopimelate desuccinylase-like protein
MKGGLGAMLAALAALHDVAPDRAARAQLYAVAGEEVDCLGSRTLVATGRLPAARCLVVGEPTGLQVVAAHKGALRLEVVVHGRAAHGARPELGANAVTAMAGVVAACAAIELPALPPHPLLGPATVSVNQISGGTAVNVVPDRCRATLDIRTLPGHDHEQIRRLVERAVAGGLDGVAGVTSEVTVLNEAAPVATDLQDPLVTAALAAASVADGGPRSADRGRCGVLQRRVGAAARAGRGADDPVRAGRDGADAPGRRARIRRRPAHRGPLLRGTADRPHPTLRISRACAAVRTAAAEDLRATRASGSDPAARPAPGDSRWPRTTSGPP